MLALWNGAVHLNAHSKETAVAYKVHRLVPQPWRKRERILDESERDQVRQQEHETASQHHYGACSRDQQSNDEGECGSYRFHMNSATVYSTRVRI